MLKLWRKFVDPEYPGNADGCSRIDRRAPAAIRVEGLPAFRIASHLTSHSGLPALDWRAARAWLERSASEEVKAAAWNACERAWLLHLRDALGKGYSLRESGCACLLSSLDPAAAQATLDYMNRTVIRVARVLQGMARIPGRGREILIVFNDAERYRGYVAHYHPEQKEEFASRRAMHIHPGCGHYVALRDELAAIERVIVHEMTHGCLAHLALPRWLNEGLAVNTQRRVAGAAPARHTPGDLHDTHRAFWGEQEIQEFWCGASFARTDDGGHLSYDLARMVVAATAADWQRFTRFVLNAGQGDGGASAALAHLGMDLGEVVRTLLEKPPGPGWAPDPGTWTPGAASRDGSSAQFN